MSNEIKNKESIYVYTSEKEVNSFLQEYKRSKVIIETTTRAILNRAIEFEEKFGKPFYEFTTEQALEMYESAHAISVVSLQNMNLLLKNASRWFAYKHGKTFESVYENITKDILLNVIDVEKQKSMVLSREDVDDIKANLLNYTDKAIIEALFLGFGSLWLRELSFFQTSQVDTSDYVVYFKTGKSIPIDKETYELFKAACEEDELLSFGSTARVAKVVSHGIYKVRANALSSNSDWNSEADLERRYRFLLRRVALISKDLGVKISPTGLQSSGLLWHLQQGIKETGMTFREYVKTSMAGELAKRYDIMSDLYAQILLEKFEAFVD
jgi:hypothetical protein